MTKKEVTEFFRKNKYAGMMLFTADRDYEAARCCILNGLSGFGLACQAIEKSLKAIIYLESGKKLKSGHDPYLLKEELKKFKDYDLDKYNDFLKKLFDWYQSRYYNNESKYGTNGSNTSYLKNLDELWVELKDKLPIPDQCKYRTYFFSQLFDEDTRWDNKWFLEHNTALVPKMNVFKHTNKKVLEELYPEKN